MKADETKRKREINICQAGIFSSGETALECPQDFLVTKSPENYRLGKNRSLIFEKVRSV